MRVVVVRHEDTEGAALDCYRSWPFAWDPLDVAVFAAVDIDDPRNEYFGQSGIGVLVSDEASLAILRELRHHFREEADPFPGDRCNTYLGFGELRFLREDTRYTVLSRDALPIEDEHGRVLAP